jgi:HSP20 family protein
MSSVVIQNFPKGEATEPFFKQVDSLFDEIRQRAFSLFERRGFGDGRDLEDWLAAERELLWSPPMDLVENDGEFRVRVAAPGFQEKEIEVTALPDAIFVEAQSERKGEKTEGKMHVSELGSRKLFRKVDLPSPIDVEKTKAVLENGVLELVAVKAGQAKEQNLKVVAAREAA